MSENNIDNDILSETELEEQFKKDFNLKTSGNIKLNPDVFKPAGTEKEKRKVGRPKKIITDEDKENIQTDITEIIDFDSEMGSLLLNLYITKALKSSELAKDKESEKFAKVMEKIINKFMPPETKKYTDLWNLFAVLFAVTYSRIDFDKKAEVKKEEDKKKLSDLPIQPHP
jgi:hypothetical protein